MPTTRTMSRKVPPYSVHSEKLLLAELIHEPDAAASVRGVIVDIDDFFNADYGRLYFALLEVRERCDSSDPTILFEAMRERGRDVTDRDADRLGELASVERSHQSAADHAAVIADKAAMRRLIHVVTDILHEAYHSEAGYDAVLAFARQHLAQLEAGE